MTADDSYSVLNRDNLTRPYQILLSQKQKPFSPFFSGFWKSTLNFVRFQKKTDDPHSGSISKVPDSKDMIR